MKEKKYNFKKIEKKWQDYWEDNNLFIFDNNKKKKKYILDMFPYPSADGLHVGHTESYTATDILARYYRQQGFNVLHPMGWDAFGLPAENFALKTGLHPQDITEKNINNFRKQIKSLGYSYNWNNEVKTTDLQYYKWTQWIFIQLFKKGLAYQDLVPINWCPFCLTGLANEEVVAGKCDRCQTEVEKKDMEQWLLKITDYAERLLSGLDNLDWPEKIKVLQRNWLGKSEGVEIIFRLKDINEELRIFTTRPDTIYGVTYMALAPEHKILEKYQDRINNYQEIKEYIKRAKNKSELERTDLAQEKTGVLIDGLEGFNPVNGEELPIFVADYILDSYGSGVVMAVPAHDQRDWEFAHKFNLPLKQVVNTKGDIKKGALEEEGLALHSGKYTGLKTVEVKKKIVKYLIKKNLAQEKINYKLRDWIFSRQRYWGEPIPVVHCQKCGIVAVPEEDLPVELPKVENYKPTGTGESPLAKIEEWVNTQCPKCQGKAKRETNTMPQWAGSSWYWLRYIDSQNDQKLADQKLLKKYLPVDLYIGGAEHAVLHLLYARFWNMFLYDLKVVPQEEPFLKLFNQGMILAADGKKMSKSRGNVVNPDDLIAQYGADVLRLQLMFMGPLEDEKPWQTKSIKGVVNFLKKVYFLADSIQENRESEENNKLIHKTIKKVTEDIENIRFNTALATLMIFINEVDKDNLNKEVFSKLIILLSPFAPHLAEELWFNLGYQESLVYEEWPSYNKDLIKEEKIKLAIQINGKVRDFIILDLDTKESKKLREKVLNLIKVKKYLAGQEIKKFIYIKNKIISIVV